MAQTPTKPALTNLYGEDGIAIHLDAYDDFCDADEAAVRVVGRAIYSCSVEQAERSIRAEYLARRVAR